MLMIRFLLILIFTLMTSQVFAAPFRRLVNFEWEAIENAHGYEVEITQIKEKEKGKVFSFKVQEASWNGRLSAGKYSMKLRSRDRRGVPGDWSEPSEFNVNLENVNLKAPVQGAQIAAKDDEKTSLKFQWDSVGGADAYQFELSSADGATKVTKDIDEPFFELKVPVAMNYSWKVFAFNKEGFRSDGTTVGQFTVLGPALEMPKIERPESDFVREIKWSHESSKAKFEVKVSRFNDALKKWELVKSIEDTQESLIPIDSSLPGGRYSISVRATGESRPSSPPARQTFKVRNGDRSPAAEYTALVRKSIERVQGWYAIASYLITDMQFKGVNSEKNSTVAYNALGGTGRLGLGWFKPEQAWGFLGIIDLSGFTFNGKTHTFASAEANGVYRKSLNDRSELRLQVGPYFKELPETVGDPFSSSSENLKIAAAGPHFGAEVWYSMSPKFGLQLNTHIYLSLLKVSTPNGQELSPTLSSQIGFLGSYRFTPTFTGLVGYARREEKVSYKALPSNTSFAVDGDVNESTIVGNYLNFFAEWAF